MAILGGKIACKVLHLGGLGGKYPPHFPELRGGSGEGNSVDPPFGLLSGLRRRGRRLRRGLFPGRWPGLVYVGPLALGRIDI